MPQKYDLGRFKTAQAEAYAGALAEIKGGKKRGHWIWFILPQLSGLGYTPTSQYYGLQGMEEAAAYASDSLLMGRLLEMCNALLQLPTFDPVEVMGSVVDSEKLMSCMTLFALVAPQHDEFWEVLDKYYGGMMCDYTVKAAQEYADLVRKYAGMEQVNACIRAGLKKCEKKMEQDNA